MLTHVVLFKFADSQRHRLQEARDALASLWGRVPQLRSLSVGTNVLPSQRAYDLGLIATFDSLEDLAGYRAHEDHKVVAAQVDELCTATVSVDYES